MKNTFTFFYLLYISILVYSMRDYVKESLNEYDLNQSEAVQLAKEHIQIEGAILKVVTIYLMKDTFEYSYLITIARIFNNNFTVHCINIYCSRDSYWSAGVYDSNEENLLSLSFHMPLYTLLQDIVEKYYLEKSLQLNHLVFIQGCGHLYFIKSALREPHNIFEIVVIEKAKEKYNIETVFTTEKIKFHVL